MVRGAHGSIRRLASLAAALTCVACGGASSSDTGTSGATGTDATTMVSTTSAPGDTTAGPASTTSAAATTSADGSSGAPGSSSGGDASTGAPDDGTLVFAVIGDYGDDFLATLGLGGEADVADLVASWNPDFVVTVGDNNYPDGAGGTIDANIGKHYAQFIGDYVGEYGDGSPDNRFWPTLGNHDWNTPGAQPYLDYFTLPGNERYYDVDQGLVHLFLVDSETDDPDGATFDSIQGQWLQQAMEASTACFKLVFFHRAAYSSGDHGSETRMQWPFEEWGADAVVAGHDHTYERLAVGGIPYFVNGLGGSLPYPQFNEIPESEFFFNTNYGAQLVTVTEADITFDFYDISGALVDSHTVEKDCAAQ